MSKQLAPVDPKGLSSIIELRLQNQLGRAFRECFGAEQGLRVLVKLATKQMLAAGASRESIQTVLTQVVATHSASGTGKSSLITGESRAAALTAMMLQWSAGTTVADERE